MQRVYTLLNNMLTFAGYLCLCFENLDNKIGGSKFIQNFINKLQNTPCNKQGENTKKTGYTYCDDRFVCSKL